jgi:hypothetical protein
MGRTLCTICLARRAKLYTPPRCVRCATGRAPGRPVASVSERRLRERGEAPRRNGPLKGALVPMRGRGRPRLDPDIPADEIERQFQAAKRKVLAESPGVAPDAWSTRYTLENA